MPVEHIHTYLVHPGKRSTSAPEIGGTKVPLNGKMFDLVDRIYKNSDWECNIDISFKGSGGTQQNTCRDLVIDYVKKPGLPRARKIAEKLEGVTTHRSGLGLLFLITGTEGINRKVVISRFPADNANLADENRQSLSIKFLERVFMKSATSYKAAIYKDSSFQSGFWLGRAVDKQINNSEINLSDYWIAGFLDSGFRTTAAAATRRLALALKDAARNSNDVAVKSEIAAAVTLANGLAGQMTSINNFEAQFGLSDGAKAAIGNELRNPALKAEKFRLDIQEFFNLVGFRSIELDSGGMLSAETGEFDKVFEKEILDKSTRKVRFSTEGIIVNEKLKKQI